MQEAENPHNHVQREVIVKNGAEDDKSIRMYLGPFFAGEQKGMGDLFETGMKRNQKCCIERTAPHS